MMDGVMHPRAVHVSRKKKSKKKRYSISQVSPCLSPVTPFVRGLLGVALRGAYISLFIQHPSFYCTIFPPLAPSVILALHLFSPPPVLRSPFELIVFHLQLHLHLHLLFNRLRNTVSLHSPERLDLSPPVLNQQCSKTMDQHNTTSIGVEAD
ncbi:hypothetical protein BJX62DRAFT_17644 [Aspergillus germanicus]